MQFSHNPCFKTWYSLLVEEIDVGDAKLRQVVSGLAKYCSPEELTVWLLLDLLEVDSFFTWFFLHGFVLIFTFVRWIFTLSDIFWCLHALCRTVRLCWLQMWNLESYAMWRQKDWYVFIVICIIVLSLPVIKIVPLFSYFVFESSTRE